MVKRRSLVEVMPVADCYCSGFHADATLLLRRGLILCFFIILPILSSKSNFKQEQDSPETKEDTPKSSKSSPSSTDSKPTSSFIDKHILEEESPSSTIKTPFPNNEVRPDLCNSTDSELMATSLSHWLKPPKPFDIFSGKSQSGKSTDSERPIIGSVATHWSEELETVSIPPPKVWDGKGIPNSTNKYKEVQFISVSLFLWMQYFAILVFSMCKDPGF